MLCLEFGFLFKNWFFLVAPLIYLLSWYLRAVSLGNPDIIGQQAASNFYRITSEFLAIGHTLSLGVIFLASTLAIRRERQTVLLDWTNSLPNSFLSIMIAKYAAIFIYSSIYTIFFLLTFIGVGRSYGKPLPYLMEHGLSFSLQSQLSFGVSIALGMILATLISNRIVYIIVFCAWMFGTYFIEGFIIQRYNLFFLKTFHLNQFFMNSTISDSWAYRLSKKETLYSQVFVLAFSLLLLTLTIIKAATNRQSSHIKRAWFSLLVVLGITITSIVPYSSLWLDRIKNFAELKESALVMSEQRIDDAEINHVYEVTEYNLDVSRSGNSDISIHAQLTIPKKENNLFHFTLYPTLKIESISWNGKPIDYTHEGHLVTLGEVEQEKINTLEVNYSGSLNEWGYIYSSERTFAFLNGEDMFFPSYIAWYPIPGDYPIYVHIKSKYDDYIYTNMYNRGTKLYQTLPQSDFTVKLNHFHHEVLGTANEKQVFDDGSQVFQSSSAKGITLLSNKGLREEKGDLPFSIIATEDNLVKLRKELSDFSEIESYYNNWVGGPFHQNMKLAYIPSLQSAGVNQHDLTIIDEAMFYDDNLSTIIGFGDGELYDNTMLNIKIEFLSYMLFGPDSKQAYYSMQDSVLNSIMQSYLLVFYKEFYEYDWEDYEQFNGTNFFMLYIPSDIKWTDTEKYKTTIEQFDYLMTTYNQQPDVMVMLQVANEIEKGNIEQIKVFLGELYKEITPIADKTYSYDKWLEKWNSTFEKEDAQ
jgi:hypothetical protein